MTNPHAEHVTGRPASLLLTTNFVLHFRHGTVSGMAPTREGDQR